MPSRRTVLAATGTVLSVSGCVDRVPGSGNGGGTPAGSADDPADGDADGPESGSVLFELRHRERDEERVLLTDEDVRNVGAASHQRGQYFVPITISESGRTDFEATFEEAGVYEDHGNFTVRTVVDGESVYEAGIAPGLVEAVESGDWEGRFRIFAENETRAERIEERLRSGGD